MYTGAHTSAHTRAHTSVPIGIPMYTVNIHREHTSYTYI